MSKKVATRDGRSSYYETSYAALAPLAPCTIHTASLWAGIGVPDQYGEVWTDKADLHFH
jgi:hypothetical protein